MENGEKFLTAYALDLQHLLMRFFDKLNTEKIDFRSNPKIVLPDGDGEKNGKFNVLLSMSGSAGK